jgi:4-alpha-glucanotransferase
LNYISSMPIDVLGTRRAGVLLHPTSLPGPHGSGDLGEEAHRFVDWLAGAGHSVWQVLPLNPAGPGDSPYMSPSSRAGHPLLVSLPPLVQAGWLPAQALQARDFDTRACDFGRVVPWRLARLRDAARGFHARATRAQREAFEHWRAQQAGWLEDDALFFALTEAHGGHPWWTWPQALRWREPGALAAARAALDEPLQAWRFVQWCFDTQLQALRAHAHDRGVGLLGDLPIYVAHHSVDVWCRPDLFHLDGQGLAPVVAGVPPDDLGPHGQRWGNPLYRWDAMAGEGFAWWTARLAGTLAQVDAVRIDHFIGFSRYWEIAADQPGAQAGCWRPGPGRPLFDAMTAALAPRGGRLPIVAEDLGLVTPEVVALRQACGFPGMKILQFAFGGDGTHEYLPHRHPPDTVVYTGTHDNDTLRGWWAHAPARERAFAAHYLRCTEADFPLALVQAACQSPAVLAVHPMQDVLGLPGTARLNRPGTEGPPNWRWRLRWEDLPPGLEPQLAALAAGGGRAPALHLRLPPATPPHGARDWLPAAVSG